MQIAVEELERLRRQFAQIFEPALDAASEKIEQSIAATPILPPRGLVPHREEVKLAVDSYYRTAISNGLKPTRSDCGLVLQRHGYWPERSNGFMYQQISPHWPRATLSTPEK